MAWIASSAMNGTLWQPAHKIARYINYEKS